MPLNPPGTPRTDSNATNDQLDDSETDKDEGEDDANTPIDTPYSSGKSAIDFYDQANGHLPKERPMQLAVLAQHLHKLQCFKLSADTAQRCIEEGMRDPGAADALFSAHKALARSGGSPPLCEAR